MVKTYTFSMSTREVQEEREEIRRIFHRNPQHILRKKHAFSIPMTAPPLMTAKNRAARARRRHKFAWQTTSLGIEHTEPLYREKGKFHRIFNVQMCT